MASGRQQPTMMDVAQRAGVSPMTVSRAFKDGTSVSAKTRKKVTAAADDLGYVFDSTASNLRSQKTNFVAVTVPSINNANFAQTVRGLSDALRPRGLQVLLGYTDYDMAEEERLIEQLLTRRPEAIVVTGGSHTPRARRLLENAGIPVVETWDLPKDPIENVVGFSNAAAVERLVDHLVEEGKTRIAFIGGDVTRDTRGADRRHGFLRAVERHGLSADRLVAVGLPPISMREGAAAMGHLLDTRPDTEAVVCVSDLSAFGALTECQRRGIPVPSAMSIAGFGDYDLGQICVPPLTTLNPYPTDIGRQAAELILALLDGLAPDPIQTIAPELLVRGSTRSPLHSQDDPRSTSL
jgi:LacI family gluconate utilization system Gnt-I transcriptional repressor